MLLIIDNFDSFTYNIVEYFRQIHTEKDVVVHRNNDITCEEIERLSPKGIVLSPGPSHPKNAGICLEVVQTFKGQIPILGICLGHQVIGESFGGKIIKAPHAIHGKTSPVVHDNQGVFKDLPSPLISTRYHSLIIDKKTLPPKLKITATVTEKEEILIMGIRHEDYPIEGVQFHPESIASEKGKQLFENFLKEYF